MNKLDPHRKIPMMQQKKDNEERFRNQIDFLQQVLAANIAWKHQGELQVQQAINDTR
jgi:hypothetical protein